MALAAGQYKSGGRIFDEDGREVVAIAGDITVENVTMEDLTIVDGADVAQGTTTDAEAASGNGTIVAILKRIRTLLGSSATGGVGRKVTVTAGTRLALAASTACRWVIVTAETDNTGLIAVGPGNVVAAAGTQEGTILAAGDSVTFAVTDLATIKVDSTVSGDGVAYSYGV